MTLTEWLIRLWLGGCLLVVLRVAIGAVLLPQEDEKR